MLRVISRNATNAVVALPMILLTSTRGLPGHLAAADHVDPDRLGPQAEATATAALGLRTAAARAAPSADLCDRDHRDAVLLVGVAEDPFDGEAFP